MSPFGEPARSFRTVAALVAAVVLGGLPIAAHATLVSSASSPAAQGSGAPASQAVGVPSPMPGLTPPDDASPTAFELTAAPPEIYDELGKAAAEANETYAAWRKAERLRQIKQARARRVRAQRAAAERRRQWFDEHSCPVDQPRQYVDDYHPAPFLRIALNKAKDEDGDGLELRGHLGIDIYAPYGTPVRAPFDGYLKPSPNNAGGIAVKVAGARGTVYIAHLSRYANERYGKVKRAQIIGYVGNTGNARGMRPHAHFEWRPGHGRPVNPWTFLAERCL